MRQRDPYIPLEKSILGSLVRTHKLAHVRDITVEEPYASSPLAKVGGARTALGVPMLKEDELVGEAAARTLGLEIDTAEVRRAEDISPAFDAFQSRVQALYVWPMHW